MSEAATGRIKIEGDAAEFKKMVEEILKGNSKVESDAKQMGNSVGESFVTVANNSLALFERLKGYVTGLKDHVINQMKLAADVERGDVAWRMLRRQSEELFQAAQHSMEYSVGLLKVRDSVFVINDIMGKGINLNKRLYQDLIQTATSSAIRLNQPIQTMIQQFVAMGTKMEANSEEMKMLGVQVDKEQVFINYANQIGVAVNKLSEAEKKTAFLTELLGQLGDKTQVSFDEIDITTEITQAFETYIDFTTDVSERYAKKISQVGVEIDKFFDSNTKYREFEAKKQEEILASMGGKYKDWSDLVAKNTEFINGEALSFGDLARAETKVAEEWKKLKAEMSENTTFKLRQAALKDVTAEYRQGSMSIEDYTIRIEQLQNQLGINELEAYAERIKMVNDAILQEREEQYSAMDMQNIMFQKSSGSITNWANVAKKKTKEVKKEVIQVLQEGFDFVKMEEDVAKITAEYNRILGERAQIIGGFNNEIFTALHQSVMSQTKASFMNAQDNLYDLGGAYVSEIERFKKYAEEKKLSAQLLADGLSNIDKRYAENKKRLGVEELDGVKESKKIMKDVMLNAAKSTYDAILSQEEDAMQKLVANSLIQAGSGIYAKGVENVWIGFGELVSTWGVKGGEQMAVGGLQIGAGLGMGAIGNAILPSGSVSKKDDTAKLENQMAQQDKKLSDESKIYMFPSEQKWLEEINRANKKIKR